MHFNQEPFTPTESSVIASEIRKMLQHEVRMEVEFCLSEEGLVQFPDLAELVTSSPTQSVPFEVLLSIPRLQEIGVTKVDLLNALSESDIVEINGDANGIRRKDVKPLQELALDAAPSKKRKTESGALKLEQQDKHGRKAHTNKEPKLFKITLSEPIKKMKDSQFTSEMEKHLGKPILFARLYGNEGYFAIDASDATESDKKKVAHMDIQIGDVVAKIQECWDDDLDKFYKKNGSELDKYLEKAGSRKKNVEDKDEVDLVFYCNKYNDIAPLAYIFQGILSKNMHGEPVNSADEQILKEFMKYHEKAGDIIKNVKHFEVGFHPKDESMLTFFAVTKNGDKEPFSFSECADSLLENFIEPKKALQA